MHMWNAFSVGSGLPTLDVAVAKISPLQAPHPLSTNLLLYRHLLNLVDLV